MVDFLTQRGLTIGFVLEFGSVVVCVGAPAALPTILLYLFFFRDFLRMVPWDSSPSLTIFHHHLGKYVWFTFSKHRGIKSKSCYPHSLAMPRYLGPSPHLRPRICARRSRDNVNSCAGRKKARVFWTLNFGVKKS